MKIKLFIILLLTFSSMFFITYIVFNLFLIKNADSDICLDTGFCKEKLNINTKYGNIVVNKNICIKHNWTWLEDAHTCVIK